MRPLLLAVVVAMAGCNRDCRTTVHLELDFDGPASHFNQLEITISSTKYTKSNLSGSTRETLDVKIASVFLGQSLNVSVVAYFGATVVGTGQMTVPTNDSSCPTQTIHVRSTNAPAPDLGADTSACGGCGSGPCAGT